MINPNTHKTSFDIRLPNDPKSKCNKFIIKGYSLSVCFLNIAIKIVITIGIVLILLSQLTPEKVFKDIQALLRQQNISLYYKEEDRV